MSDVKNGFKKGDRVRVIGDRFAQSPDDEQPFLNAVGKVSQVKRNAGNHLSDDYQVRFDELVIWATGDDEIEEFDRAWFDDTELEYEDE